MYGSLDILKEKTKEDPVAVMKRRCENVKPVVEVKSRRSAAPPTRSRSRSARNGGSPIDPLAGRVRAGSVPRRRWSNASR